MTLKTDPTMRFPSRKFGPKTAVKKAQLVTTRFVRQCLAYLMLHCVRRQRAFGCGVLVTCCAWFGTLCAAREPPSVTALRQRIGRDGLEQTIKHFHAEDPRLARALDQVKSFLHSHDQLWFQLQARTQSADWQDWQDSLHQSIPAETLIALNASLKQVSNAIDAQWQLGRGQILELSLSSDGQRVYCGGVSALAIIDPSTLRLLKKIDVDGQVIATGSISGRDVYCVASRGGIQVREVDSGEAITNWPAVRIKHGYAGPNPAPLLLTRRGLIRQTAPLHFVRTEFDGVTERRKFHINGQTAFQSTILMQAIENGTTLLMADDDGSLRHLELESLAESRARQVMRRSRITSCQLSPDESMVAASFVLHKSPASRQTNQGGVRVWDRLAGRKLFDYVSLEEPIVSCTFLGDGETVIGGGQTGGLLAWRGDQRPINNHSIHQAAVTRLLTAPDGRSVFSGDASGCLKVTTPTRRVTPAKPRPLVKPLTPRRFSPDGDFALDFKKRTFSVTNCSTNDTRRFTLSATDVEFLGSIRSIALASGVVLLGGDEAVIRFDLTTRLAKQTRIRVAGIPVDKNQRRGDQATKPVKKLAVAVSPNGKHAVVWRRNALVVYDLASEHPTSLILADVRQLGNQYGFLSKGRFAVTFQSSSQGKLVNGIAIFDLVKGRLETKMLHGSELTGVVIEERSDTIATSGRRLTGKATSNSLISWDPETGAERGIRSLAPEHGVLIASTKDGERLLTLHKNPGRVFTWDQKHHEPQRRFDLGINISSGRLDGDTLILSEPPERYGEKTREHWFEYRHPRESP